MKYVYGFIKAGGEGKSDFGPIGVAGNGEEVCTLPRDGVAAVISQTRNPAIGSLPKKELVGCLAQHQLVAETVMKAGSTILPMEFGTVLDSDAQVAEMLEANREKLWTLLGDIEGLFEVDVVVMWPDIQQVFAEIARYKEIVELKSRIAELPSGESMAARLSLGKLAKDRLDAKKRALQERLLPPWERVARRTVRHEIRNDAVGINAAFLLNADDRDTLEALVNKADQEEGGSLDFRMVGPLPPYAFSTVQCRRAQLAELDAARCELSLPECITPQALAQAARTAMRRFHPDTDSADDDLPEKFERVKAATDLLRRFCPPRGLDLRDTGRREFLLVEPTEAA